MISPRVGHQEPDAVRRTVRTYRRLGGDQCEHSLIKTSTSCSWFYHTPGRTVYFYACFPVPIAHIDGEISLTLTLDISVHIPGIPDNNVPWDTWYPVVPGVEHQPSEPLLPVCCVRVKYL